MQILWLVTDSIIALAYIALPWVILTKVADSLDMEWPDWLDDGVVGMVIFVTWAGFAIYFARQTTLWMGFGP